MTSIISQAQVPQSVEEALFVAALGTDAIALLRYVPGRPVKLALACITALGMASRSSNRVDDFIEAVLEYEQDARQTVQKASQQMVRNIQKPRSAPKKPLWQQYFMGEIEVNGATTLQWLQYLSCWPKYRRALILRDAALSSLQGITRLPDLEKLRLCHLPITDLAPLVELANLQTLELYDLPNMQDLSPLIAMPELRTLRLQGELPFIRDIDLLSQLSKLTELSLDMLIKQGEEWGEDLSVLATCAQLQRLQILRHPVRTMVLPSTLSTLYLNRCTKLVDYTFLSTLTNVSSLQFYHCAPIDDAEPLSWMNALSRLTLNNTSCRDLSPLAELPNLVDIDLVCITGELDLKPLAASRSLRRLHIETYDPAQLHTIGVLSQSPSLRKLELVARPHSSKYEDLDLMPLCHAPGLRYVNIAANKIDHIKGVAELKKRGVTFNLKYTPKDVYK